MEKNKDTANRENYLYLSLYVIVGILIFITFSSFVKNTFLSLETLRYRSPKATVHSSTDALFSLKDKNTNEIADEFRIIRNRLIRERLKPDDEKTEELFNTIEVFDERRENLTKRRQLLIKRLKGLKARDIKRQTLEALVTEIASLGAEISRLDAEEIRALGRLLTPEQELKYLQIKRDALRLTEADKSSSK